MLKKKQEGNLVVCKVCGHEASGPNVESVKAAAERHRKKKHKDKIFV